MVPNNVDALEWLRKHLDAEGSDLLREMVRTFAERLMGAELEVLCNAGYGEITAGVGGGQLLAERRGRQHRDAGFGVVERVVVALRRLSLGSRLTAALAARSRPPVTGRAGAATDGGCADFQLACG
jgi:hypothetical protein